MITIVQKEIDITDYPFQLKSFRIAYQNNKISEKEFRKILLTKNNIHRLQSIIARNMLVYYFDKKGLFNYMLSSSKNNVPMILGVKSRYFISISHSNKLITVAISDHRIGIDTEYTQRKFPSTLRTKWGYLQYIHPYRTWTAIESYLKYKGIGLASGFSNINILFSSPNQNTIVDQANRSVYYSITLKKNSYLITMTQKKKISIEQITLVNLS